MIRRMTGDATGPNPSPSPSTLPCDALVDAAVPELPPVNVPTVTESPSPQAAYAGGGALISAAPNATKNPPISLTFKPILPTPYGHLILMNLIYRLSASDVTLFTKDQPYRPVSYVVES